MADTVYVTREICETKFKSLVRSISILFVVSALFATVAGWSIIAGQSAIAQANAAIQAVEVYKASQDVEMKHMIRVSDELKLEIRELRTAIDRLSRQLVGTERGQK